MNERLDLAEYRRTVTEMYLSPSTGDPGQDWTVWTGRRDELFRSHPQSSLTSAQKTSFRGLSYFPHDPGHRVEATLEEAAEQDLLTIDTGGEDGVVEYEQVGVLRTPVGSLTLFWMRGYGGGLFLPFRDATAGTSTYGGGRYLTDTVKGTWGRGLVIDGDRITVDFNYAYNPSCAYNSRYACPLAPRSNHLTGEIAAGEKVFESPV